MIETQERCDGKGCSYRGDCSRYDMNAGMTLGHMDSDFGWTCDDFERKDEPIVETDEDDEQPQLF